MLFVIAKGGEYMKLLINYLRKYIWNTAINSKLSYSRYGMYEPKKPSCIEKYLND